MFLSNIPKIKLDDLLKGKYKNVNKNTLSPPKPNLKCLHNPKQIDVVSPFFQRSKCLAKGPCTCPYHRKEKIKVNVILKNRIKTRANNQDFNRNNEKRIRTEQTQAGNKSEDNIASNNRQALGSITQITGVNGRQNESANKNSFHNILHKVQCRNQEFEKFLKQNELYILTGKMGNTQKKSRELIKDSFFLQKLSKDIEMDQKYDSQYDKSKSKQQSENSNLLKVKGSTNFIAFSSSKEIHKTETIGSRFHSRKNILDEKQNVVNRLYLILESVLKGQKALSFENIKKARDIFGYLIKDNIQNSTKEDKQNSKFRGFLSQFNNNFSETVDKIRQNSKSSSYSLNQKKKKDIKQVSKLYESNKNHFSYHNSQKKQQVKLGILIKKSSQNKSKRKYHHEVRFATQDQEDASYSENHENHENRQSQISSFSNDKKNSKKQFGSKYRQLSSDQQGASKQGSSSNLKIKKLWNNQLKKSASCMIILNNVNHKLNKYNKKILSNQIKQVRAAAQVQNKTREDRVSKLKEAEQLGEKIKYCQEQHCPFEVRHCKQQHIYLTHKSGKQEKLQPILTDLQQRPQAIDLNYLKMRKYVQRNRRFLNKMKMKLLHLDLGTFTIEQTDSLMTRKKKIRCLQEIVENENRNETLDKSLYDEILRYLEIYNNHIKMVIKNTENNEKKKKNMAKVKVTREEFDVEFDYKEDSFNLKEGICEEYLQSLKFISLHQDTTQDKKLEGWISIPQYVTKERRHKNIDPFLKSSKYIETLLNKPETIQSSSDDSLVQKDLQNRCTVSTYQQLRKYSITEMDERNSRAKLKALPHSSFTQKLRDLRRKLICNS